MTPFEQDILDFITSEKATTCVALYQLFGQGDAILINATVHNVVCAFGMSDELAVALNNLLDVGEVVDIPCTPEEYSFDGAILNLPLTDGLMPVEGYAEPHWQPIMYTTYENAINYLDIALKDDPVQLAEVKARLEAKRKVSVVEVEQTNIEQSTELE